MILALGLVVLAALLITVVIDVSQLFLARRDLLAAADGAALAGAQAVDEARVYREGVQGSLPLDPVAVRRSVEEYLRDAGLESSIDGLQWSVVTDGTFVRVEVAGSVRLPVVNRLTPGAADGVAVSASAAARSAVVP